MVLYENIKRFVICLLLLTGLGSFIGCVANPATGENDLILISDSAERSIGERSAPDFEKEFGGRHGDIHLQSYIYQLGSSLAKVSDRDIGYQFVLLNSNIPNAFALPGGKIYVTAGMMRAMENEMQLSAVLAHEIAHVAARHNVKALQRQMGASVLVNVSSRLANNDTTAQTVAELVTNLTYLRYSRKDEHEADLLGANYMIKAGLDPWGIIEMLKVLERMSPSESGGAITLFRTHPLTTERIGQAERHVLSEFGPPFANRSSDRNANFHSMLKLLK
jgi:predicted Zn-dependent protease